MRNIRLFENYEDFLAIQEAVSGSGKYVEDIFPGFAYTKDMYSGDTYAYYNGHEEEQSDYHFGDVVYLASDGKLKSVYWSDYDESMGEKVGLIVVPTSHAADGNARMIAFENAMRVSSSSQPSNVLGEAANENYFFQNQGNWYGDLVANGVLCWDIPEGARGGVGDDPYIYYMNTLLTAATDTHVQYLSSDFARSMVNPMSPSEGYPIFNEGPKSSTPTRDGNVLGTGTIDFGGRYYNDGIFLGVSPYLADGTQNPNYVEPDWTYQGSTLKNPFADWNGYANTYKLQSFGEDAAYAAMQYSTTGTSTGDWYVGAFGEMGYVAARAWAISYIMHELDGQDLFLTNPNGHYLNPDEMFTSTELNESNTGHTGQLLNIYHYQTGLANGGYEASSPNGEEYPTDIPQFKGSDAKIFATYDIGYGTVRPMAMIKAGEIQHAQYTPRPESGFDH